MRKQRAPRVDSRLNDMRRGGQKRNIPRKQKAVEGQFSESPQNPYPKRRTSLQAGLAVLGGRTAGALSRRLHLGGGTSIAGLVAQKVYPDIVGHLATQLEFGSVIVTGTNGKTTTSAFIAAILSDAGLRVWRNREGSNLMGGIASSLIMRAMPNGQMRRAGQAMTILEVDEAVVPQVVETVSPRLAVFTNLFRDQLDRYGEVDDVAAHWQHAVTNLSAGSILVVNADDPATANLGKLFKGRVLYYGIDDPSLDLTKQQGRPERHQVSDARTCPQCGGDYTYDMRFFSHMGHYHCTSCGNERPQLDVRVVKAQTEDFDRLRIGISSSLLPATQPREIVIPLPGIYNIYNALAAVTAAQALEIGWEPIVSGIEQFKPIFGRGERIQVEGRTLRLLLAKNPTGFNEVLRTLFSDEGIARNILFVLNNNIADGRDVSWIWDVDFEQVVGRTATLVAAGSRALDLALRLKYAGISQQEVIIVPPAPLRATKRARVLNNHNKRASKNSKMGDAVVTETIEQVPSTKRANRYGIAEALDAAVQLTPAGETLFVVPTYTGLLEIHGELERRGLTPHYWEERDS
jgi:lipid II isoglutaminyl synthase (glutamine-hydrolysing)